MNLWCSTCSDLGASSLLSLPAVISHFSELCGWRREARTGRTVVDLDWSRWLLICVQSVSVKFFFFGAIHILVWYEVHKKTEGTPLIKTCRKFYLTVSAPPCTYVERITVESNCKFPSISENRRICLWCCCEALWYTLGFKCAIQIHLYCIASLVKSETAWGVRNGWHELKVGCKVACRSSRLNVTSCLRLSNPVFRWMSAELTDWSQCWSAINLHSYLVASRGRPVIGRSMG